MLLTAVAVLTSDLVRLPPGRPSPLLTRQACASPNGIELAGWGMAWAAPRELPSCDCDLHRAAQILLPVMHTLYALYHPVREAWTLLLALRCPPCVGLDSKAVTVTCIAQPRHHWCVPRV